MLFAQVMEKEQKELKEAIEEAKEAKWYRVPKLAEMFDIVEGRVREYIKTYNEDGIDGLRPGKSPGRRVVIPLSKEEWEKLLTRRPSQFEALKTKIRNRSQPLPQSVSLPSVGG